ncbi:MAG: hypothetical protein FD149_1115 [Rhodospirillaceae bacterium]|nr:MAG: hypothetical protein FD149_1115 [Rhodospirillaceae bacterium]
MLSKHAKKFGSSTFQVDLRGAPSGAVIREILERKVWTVREPRALARRRDTARDRHPSAERKDRPSLSRWAFRR